MEKIKLVIWDLDETFWKGTLSDGTILPIQNNIDIVRKLTDRGIVNSICSKNDFDAVKEKLEEMGLWEYFVFPSINWEPKGGRVKTIVSDMNLRPINVLFVDDSINNLEEVQFVIPEINTVLACDFENIIGSEAFEGKDDFSHSRLQQYHILEKSVKDKNASASNEEFLYQSNINVDMIEPGADEISRIHEMIHRNNQLNFTKDRISLEDVQKIFTDSSIRSGYVRVKDKYGDHGIIGCYALDKKTNKLLQFVFSCRILGMGVEQWCYAQLGYPEIHIVGDVAAELIEGECPQWINQKTDELQKHVGKIKQNVVLYGTCPLRPVWSYLQPQLAEGGRFAEIDPAPSICNLASLLREPDDRIKEWVNKVNIFDSRYTFDTDIINGNTDYLLITLDREWNTLKYVNGDNSTFYSQVLLTESNCSKDILETYKCTQISIDDIEKELRVLLSKTENFLRVLIMTLPEVVFPSIGEDDNYKWRLKLNKLVEVLETEYINCDLVDIRKYAREPADFFDLSSNHYNRQIGYLLSQDILKLIGNDDDSKHFFDNQSLETSTRLSLKTNINVRIKNTLINGVLSTFLEIDGFDGKCEITYDFIRNSFLEERTEWIQERSITRDIGKYGLWQVVVHIRFENDDTYIVKGTEIDYRDFNILKYSDSSKENYEQFVASVDMLHKDYQKSLEYANSLVARLSEVVTSGMKYNNSNFMNYFSERKKPEISILADDRILDMIMPFVGISNVKINRIFVIGNLKKAIQRYGDAYRVVALKKKNLVDVKNEDILFAVDGYQIYLYRGLFRERKCRMHSLLYILNCMKTENVIRTIMDLKSIKRLYAVRTGNLGKLNGMPFTYVKSLEKQYVKKKAVKFQGGEVSVEWNNGVCRFKEMKSDTVNISCGHRMTCNNPKEYQGTIYLFGDSTTFGIGVRDDETIASCLQELCPDYRVLNYANCLKPTDFDRVLGRIREMDYSPDDIVILIIPYWMPEKRTEVVGGRPNWIEWDAFDFAGAEKIDCFPIFADANRPEYFISKYNYNAEGNKAIAADIYKQIFGK